MTLRATFMGGPETRTEFGRSTTSGSYSEVKWVAKDSIKVFSSDGFAKYITENGSKEDETTAVFALASGDALASGPYLGLSPFDETASANVSSDFISATIPVEQLANPGHFDPSALLAVGSSSTADQMAFYNVCSGLCFTLTGSNVSNYKSIELTGNDGEKVAGKVKISCSTPDSPVAMDGSSTSVSLILPEGESFGTNKTYYLLFRPGVFKKGFTLTFKDASGKSLTDLCTCTSYVEFKCGVFAKISGVDNPKKLAAIRDGDLLSKDGTANCYIVSKDGSYKFPLSRATEDEFLSGITGVDVLWETDNTGGTQTTGSIITNVGTNKKYVYFDVPRPLKNGNAVIVAYRDGVIAWSWHIWVCSDDPSTKKQKLIGKSSAMMDRNLGALSPDAGNALANGLFYQWGRKDPFPGAVESYVSSSGGGHFMKTTTGETLTVVSSESVNATEDYAIANPDKFISTTKNNGDWLATPKSTLWGQTKTIYDPCPPGWKVPVAYMMDSNNQHVLEQEAWSDDDGKLNPQRVASNGYYGVYLNLESGGGRAWYPNNGYISLAGKLLMVGQYSCYWSCSPNSLATYAMEMSQTSSTNLTYNGRQYGKVRGEGHSVRCVKE